MAVRELKNLISRSAQLKSDLVQQMTIVDALRTNMLTIRLHDGYKCISSSTEDQSPDDSDPDHQHDDARCHHYTWMADDTRAGEGPNEAQSASLNTALTV